jgi:hypothetical protein
VPTASFRGLFVFVVLAHHRRRVMHFNVTAHPRMVKIFDRTIQRQITYDVRSPCKTKNGCGCWPM